LVKTHPITSVELVQWTPSTQHVETHQLNGHNQLSLAPGAFSSFLSLVFFFTFFRYFLSPWLSLNPAKTKGSLWLLPLKRSGPDWLGWQVCGNYTRRRPPPSHKITEIATPMIRIDSYARGISIEKRKQKFRTAGGESGSRNEWKFPSSWSFSAFHKGGHRSIGHHRSREINGPNLPRNSWKKKTNLSSCHDPPISLSSSVTTTGLRPPDMWTLQHSICFGWFDCVSHVYSIRALNLACASAQVKSGRWSETGNSPLKFHPPTFFHHEEGGETWIPIKLVSLFAC
jgi:hypothetical protein